MSDTNRPPLWQVMQDAYTEARINSTEEMTSGAEIRCVRPTTPPHNASHD